MIKLIALCLFVSLGLVAQNKNNNNDGDDDAVPNSASGMNTPQKVRKSSDSHSDSGSDSEVPDDEQPIGAAAAAAADQRQPAIWVTPNSRAAQTGERLASRQVHVLYQGNRDSSNNQIYMITLGNIDFSALPIFDFSGRSLTAGELREVVDRIFMALQRVPPTYFYVGRTVAGVVQRARGHNDGFRNSPERRLYHAIHASGQGASMHTLVMGVSEEQLAELESQFIIRLGALERLGLNSNAGNPRVVRSQAPGQLEPSPSTAVPGAGQRYRVDAQLQRIAHSDDDGALPNAWQSAIYAVAPEGANTDFLGLPIVDLQENYLDETALLALSVNLQRHFEGTVFERYVGLAGAGESGDRVLLDRLDEHRRAVAENPHRRFPFAIRRWNAEGQTGVMHALIVNAHPEQLRELEAITMRAANTMGPLGVNAMSPSRTLFGGRQAPVPEEVGVAQGLVALARENLPRVLGEMWAVFQYPLVGGVLQIANRGFGGPKNLKR